MRTLIALCLFIFAAAPALAESAYDRVMRTGEIRCGYALQEPLLMKDPNTGALSGVFYDYLEALGKALSLKVVWAEEVGWGDFPAALNSGRIDAMCSGIWPTAGRARVVDFTAPVYFNAINAYTGAGTTRFDGNLSAINDPGVTIATMDGEMSSIIAAADFPRARTLAVPQVASLPQILVNVARGKADVTFTDTATAAGFMAHNPGALRMVEGGAGVRVFGNTIAIARGAHDLKAMLDTASGELHQSGVIERILQKHETYPGSLLRVAKPYETPAP
ncbi:MAG: transporter substrate-binding domain-containing protein [Alphaproteobacteria bacterium]|jgi:ABC-type amino acid transport substrate-binding protein|nr:transporter substrate-binding domain-containing protein [Alphaproteobacteria bacterium]